MPSDVTVLIPVRGDAPFLNQTLNSISRNTSLPKEVLIIDDGISHACRQALEQAPSKCALRVVASQGKGLVAALNTGLRLANTRFICRIDSDDLMHENRIQVQIEYLRTHPDVVAIGSQLTYINESGRETGKSNYPVGALNRHPEFKKRCLIAHPSTMYRKTDALRVEGYRSIFSWNDVDIAEDFDFWLRLSRFGNIEIVNEFLTSYRQHSSQISAEHSLGQIFGTPYIAAVNLQSLPFPKKIEFKNFRSPDQLLYFKTIASTFGASRVVGYKLQLIIANNKTLLHSRILNRIFNRVIAFLIR